MKTIHKYALTGQCKQVLQLPMGSAILGAVCQHSIICIYAMVDSDCQETADLEIGIAGTGWDLTDDDIYSFKYYLATVEDREEGYVWHIFGRPRIK